MKPIHNFAVALIFAVVFPASGFAQGNIGKGRSPEVSKRITPVVTAQFDKADLRLGSPVFVRIFKTEKELEIWVEKEDGRFGLFKMYPICYYSGTLGPKQKAGDNQTPEGFYFVTPGNLNPWSNFHLSFNLGYPNSYERHLGRTGSALMVHGSCVSIGCYAMTNKGIEEIYAVVEAALREGQPFFRVHAFPFRMTEDNMKLHEGSEWINFWRNLKDGYDYFEAHGRPPNVQLDRSANRYTFGPS